MSTVEAKIQKLTDNGSSGYWGERIIAQLGYALKLSKINDHKFDSIIERAADFLSQCYTEDNAITKQAAIKAEEMITELSGAAKEYTVLCAAHAHIDMNWMWGWHETVAVTLDTFKTMLDLLDEYPDYKFSQSQASIYKIVEEFAPEMLEEIKARVQEGRWEVTASHWVEADKNMPNGESLTRHLLYTKRYLSKLLNIDPDSLNIDFEPDTFGHSANVPEILSQGGVKYYYHCRGYDGYNLYNWRAPSGQFVTVYREPHWYNDQITAKMALFVPEFCQQHNMTTMLRVYGVGDHGGGPTRRDIERIIDMDTWPVFPNFNFGTFGQFFQLVEKVKNELPTVDHELNHVFTGCYTSQSRIKMANRFGEAALNEAETFGAISTLNSNYNYPTERLTKSWTNVLFNQFHDIIPGSGVVETREHAMGLFQETMANANSITKLSMQGIASAIDTSQLVSEDEDIKETISEGAGVGFGANRYKITSTEQGSGKTRIFHIFNSSSTTRNEAAELVIWDWQGNKDKAVFKDNEGNVVEHQLLDHGFNHYWGHHYMRVLIKTEVPAFGYTTYTLTEDSVEIPMFIQPQPRVERPDEFILENDYIKVTFDTVNASIKSFIDKSNGEEIADQNRNNAIFRFIKEDVNKGMTSWIVGRYMNVQDLTENVKIRKVNYSNSEIRQSLSYEIEFNQSKLKAMISLDYNSPSLHFDIECDWHEMGKPGEYIPQLNFHMPFSYQSSAYKYDIPFGVVERETKNLDVPGNSWALGLRGEVGKNSVMLVTDSKYGFRGYDNAIGLTLLRGSYDPDPYPEVGINKFRFTISLVDETNNKALIEHAYNINHPLNVITDKPHKGTLPTKNSFLSINEGSIALSALKKAEDSNELILRFYETEGNSTKASIQFADNVKDAYFVDATERKLEGNSILIQDGKVNFDVSANSIAAIAVKI